MISFRCIATRGIPGPETRNLSQTLKHAAILLLWRVATTHMECFEAEALPGAEQDWLALERTTSDKIWIRISCSVNQTDFRLLSYSAWLYLYSSAVIWEAAWGVDSRPSPWCSEQIERGVCPHLGQRCQEAGSILPGVQFPDGRRRPSETPQGKGVTWGKEE